MRKRLLARLSLCLTCALCPFMGMATAQDLPGSDTPIHSPALEASRTVDLAADEPRPELKHGKVIRAFRITGTSPVVDGDLSDEVWSLAEQATGFTQRDPDNGDPMTEDTFVQVAYDDRYLYVAVTCEHRDPESVAAGLSRRDQLSDSTDEISINVDPRHDHQTGYGFQTNPSAVQVDYSWYNDESQDRDYDAVWDVRTARTSRGWTAEFRIPFSQLRFSAAPGSGQVWGFNVSRQIRRKAEFGTWVPRPRGERGEVSLFGHLIFEAPLVPPRRLEVMPYLLTRSAHLPGHSAQTDLSGGVDLRMGIGTGATLAAAFNPDFGQVEQDPAVLNLSVFESFFPERRPFFLEDSRTFVPPVGLFQLFHSRRIGRSPGRLPVDTAEQVFRRPSETTILGATKLTGKGSGWTYGVLTALTAREYAEVETPVVQSDGAVGTRRDERLIEPATSYNVARIQRDVRRGTSNIGGIVTAVVRDQSENAFTGGVDYNLRWDQNRLRWDGHWALTRAPGPGGTRTGGGGVTNVNISRKHVSGFVHYDHFSRDFRVTDIGFFRTRANRNQVNGGMEAGTPDPWKGFRRIWTGFNLAQGWTNERLVFERSGETWLSVQFRNFWQTSGGMFGSFEALDDLDTRGGPPIVKPAYRGVFYNLNSDPRKRWRWNLNMNRGASAVGGWFANVNTGFSVQASDRLQASIGTSYNLGRDIAQWIINSDTNDDGVLEHVYGTLRRNVLDISLRGTYSFTRDLTVQAYLQPFVAVGRYSDIRRLAQPRSFEFEPVTLPFNPDFNRKSLRGNVVMRWEYKPGSTFFFVWDLSQSDLSRPGMFSPLRDLRSAFGAEASHVLMVKASYWLNR
jgi:hypothetical protein